MTAFEVIITAAVNVVTGGIVYLYKDKKKSDADHLTTIINNLSKELERLDKQNERLDKIITAEKEEKIRIIDMRDTCLKRVHELEVKEQIKNNEITLLKLKTNTPDENNNY